MSGFFVGYSSRVFAARLLPILYGAPIKLLVDAETAGLNLNNNLTIDGNDHALKFTDKGIALWGHALVLKDVNASMAGVGSTPYTAEWNWMSACANKDVSPTLDDATLAMDGTGAGNVHAIYFCNNNKLNLKNGSNLTIKNYKQDALEWDGGDGGYNVNIEGDSTYTSDHCRSGFTGTFIVTVDNSTVTADNNALTDIIFTGKGEFKSANVQISGTKGTSCWYTAKEQQPVDGWTFDGWYADEDCAAKWDDDAELATSMMLFDKWTKNADPDQ